jgi:hypothetical protein
LSANTRFAGLIAVFLLLAAGCVHNKAPGAGVQAITTDLQYKQLQQKNAAPANTVPAAITQGLPAQPTLPPFSSGGVLGPLPAGSTLACPTAAPTAQAQQDVTPTIGSLPVPGSYLWRVKGRQLFQNHELALPTLTKRSIMNVQGTASPGAQSFTFQTEEKQFTAVGAAATVRSFFSVTSQTSSDFTHTGAAGHNVNSPSRTSTAGLRLNRLEVTPPGGSKAVFAPSQPVRLLITPVLEGPDNAWSDHVVDVSSDPSAPQSFVINAYVKGRTTVDACGERIRGWLVSSDQTYSQAGSSVTRHIDYGVATQMGGIYVFEHVESPCTRQSNGTCQEGKPVLEFDANYGKKLS